MGPVKRWIGCSMFCLHPLLVGHLFVVIAWPKEGLWWGSVCTIAAVFSLLSAFVNGAQSHVLLHQGYLIKPDRQRSDNPLIRELWLRLVMSNAVENELLTLICANGSFCCLCVFAFRPWRPLDFGLEIHGSKNVWTCWKSPSNLHQME